MTTSPPTPPADVKGTLSDAMARLWAKFRPEIERRVAVLEAASAALGAGTLSTQQREAAHADAHKLAGSLGTFGLHRGTDLARMAESALAADPVRATAPEFTEWVAEIRALVSPHQ